MFRSVTEFWENWYIIGENDAGLDKNGKFQHPGKDGVESTFVTLRHMCEVIRVYPPEGVKDLRDWVTKGLTHDELVAHVKENSEADGGLGPNTLENDIAIGIAKRFLRETYTQDKGLALRNYRDDWYEWNGQHYVKLTLKQLRGVIYEWLEDKMFMQKDGQGGEKLVPYKASKAKMNDIIDTFSSCCLIETDPPVWVGPKSKIAPSNLIMFENGALDVDDYVHGKITFHDPSPELFSLNCCPYNYDEDARSQFVEDFLSETFEDEESVNLNWEWGGYLLTPDISREKFMLLHGVVEHRHQLVIQMLLMVMEQLLERLYL